MSKKKIVTAAVAAAMGFAVSADVIEVKFTVKTDVNSKVASKVISGLYDTESNKHVFWTTEKRDVLQANGKFKKVNQNEAIKDSYFGLVNDATVAKKVGQNAELIWGKEGSENVLVAGAWGTDKSKSGQAAGTFNGKPATGTWSAKLNTKKTFAELCEKNKIVGMEDVNNRTQGVIADLNDKVAAAQDKAAADIKAAEDKAAADIKAAEDKAAEDIKAAKKEGAEALKAAQDKAAEEIADVKEKAAADIKAAQDKAAEEIAAAKDEADAALAAKQQELDAAVAKLTVMTDSFNKINDPDMPNMFSDYLDETAAGASNLFSEAQAKIDNAEEKYTAYTNSLDDVALRQDYVTKSNDWAEAVKVFEALSVTNEMIGVIDAGQLEDYFNGRKSATVIAIATKTNEIVVAQEGFDEYTNNLVSITIPAKTADLETAVNEAEAARQTNDVAWAAYVAATNAVANYEAPTYENGKLKSFDDFIAEQEAAGETFASELEKYDAYEDYKNAKNAAAYADVTNACETARLDYVQKHYAMVQKDAARKDALEALTEEQNKLTEAIELGKAPGQAELEAQLADLQAKLDAFDEEYESWRKFSYSDADRETYATAKDDAEDDMNAKGTAKDEAKAALDDMEAAQSTRLSELAIAIDKTATDLYGSNGKPLPVVQIRAMVDEYLAKYRGYVDSANATLEAIADIRNELGL